MGHFIEGFCFLFVCLSFVLSFFFFAISAFVVKVLLPESKVTASPAFIFPLRSNVNSWINF